MNDHPEKQHQVILLEYSSLPAIIALATGLAAQGHTLGIFYPALTAPPADDLDNQLLDLQLAVERAGGISLTRIVTSENQNDLIDWFIDLAGHLDAAIIHSAQGLAVLQATLPASRRGKLQHCFLIDPSNDTNNEEAATALTSEFNTLAIARQQCSIRINEPIVFERMSAKLEEKP